MQTATRKIYILTASSSQGLVKNLSAIYGHIPERVCTTPERAVIIGGTDTVKELRTKARFSHVAMKSEQLKFPPKLDFC